MMDFEDIFALEPLELGKTNIVKHSIKVNNLIPFKERYSTIPVQKGEKTSERNGADRSNKKIQ